MKIIITAMFVVFSTLLWADADPVKAYQMVKEGKAIFVDVREADEVKAGMIDKAVWFPLSKIKSHKDWKKDFTALTKGREIFLYCRSGNRSGMVQAILKENKVEAQNIGGYESIKASLKSKSTKTK